MQRPFRIHHLLQALDEWEQKSLPIDVFLHNYFRLHRALGSKDRKWVADTIYEIIRWRGLLDTTLEKPISWEKRLEALAHRDKIDLESLPLYSQVSFPENLFRQISNAYGSSQALAICRASNERAPTTIRVNLLKTSREHLLSQLEPQGLILKPCQHTATGLHVLTNTNFNTLAEYKNGYFDLQDEGSQLIAELVEASSNNWVLDYCAGAGGKALAIAPKLNSKARLFLHDVRQSALDEARKRLDRAGVINATILGKNSREKEHLLGKMHWVLVDAPCSGTGTLRRSPDLKWSFDELKLAEVVNLQKKIFSEALAYLRPDAHIVYATCSILPQENQEQTAFFIKTYGLRKIKEFHSVPSSGQMDGFYGAVLVKA